MTDKSKHISQGMGRRDFLRSPFILAAGAGLVHLTRALEAETMAYKKLPKAIVLSMVAGDIDEKAKLAVAKACGYDGVEVGPPADENAAAELVATAKEIGIEIHSIMFGGWHAPFSSPDTAKIDEGLKGMENALRCAKVLGASTVLLVPAVVNAEIRYADAYERSQQHIRKLLPLAAEVGVTIAVENVWNDFLLSPIEFARYIDEFDSPWLRAYFDVGNIVKLGWPQDWIRTLAHRIVKVHLKDFTRKGQEWKNLRDGDINWPEIRKALDEVGYASYVTAELQAGDEAYLRDVAQRIDLIVSGQ